MSKLKNYLLKILTGITGTFFIITPIFQLITLNSQEVSNLPEINLTKEDILNILERNKILQKMEDLALCESSNNPLALNPDDKGTPSYGLFQYKETTWKRYIKQYNLLPEAEEHEYMNFIYDEELQRKLTFLILKNEKDGWRHWYNCGIKIGLNNLK